MKSRTLMALAVAGTFACAGAFAGGGAQHGAASGSSSGGYDYQSAGMTGSHEMALSDSQTIDSGDSITIVEYWRLGEEPSATGRSSSTGGSGRGGFDSMNSGARPGSMSGSGASDASPVLRGAPPTR